MALLLAAYQTELLWETQLKTYFVFTDAWFGAAFLYNFIPTDVFFTMNFISSFDSCCLGG